VSRRAGLIASAVASVLLLLAMSPAENRMRDAGGPGVIPFEVTGGQEKANEIMAEWGEEGKDAARESLWIDFGFLIAYGTFLTLALRAARDVAVKRGWHRLEAIGAAAIWFGAICAGFDALENVCLLLTLGGAGAAAPLLATVFASLKFLFLAASLAYLLAALAALLLGRRSAEPAA
jgi:hypothetical protein